MSADTVDRATSRVSPDDAKPMSAAYRRYAMSVLLLIAIMNYLDRNVIHILAEPIKNDLGLADWQLGLLSGLAFGLLYTFLGLPIARLAERKNRPVIIACATGIWSVFTVMCGFVQNFAQLALARVGVGVGEAGCTPPAHSLIMDYVEPEKRSSALAFYGLGPPIGGLLGMAFGGLVADAYGWRTAFWVAGAPGLAFALLAAVTLAEPRKTISAGIEKIKDNTPSLVATVRLLASKESYRFMAAAQVLKVFIQLGYLPFLASFYFRNHADQLATSASAVGEKFGYDLGPIGLLGISLGILSGLGSALGVLAGGALADRFGPSDPRCYVYIPAIAAIAGIPVFVGAMLASSVGLSLALIAVHAFIASIWYGPAFAAAYSISPGNMRATNSAILLFLSNLFGLGLAPLAVGIISDVLGASMGVGEGLRWALIILAMAGFLTAFLFWRSARTLREDIES
ncbi:MAG: MFS transporter [Sphingomonadaceae bacterium]|nr:MFS transporter [Sphingomonadaceae bacterium]